MLKNPPSKAGDESLIPGSGRSPGEGTGNPHQYFCLKKSQGQRSLAVYRPCGNKRVGYDLATKNNNNDMHIQLSKKTWECICILLSLTAFRNSCHGAIFICNEPDCHGHKIINSCCCCSVAQSCPTLCDPMDCSLPGLPVPHYLLNFAQDHVYCSRDDIQPSYPLTFSSPSALNLS